MKKLFCLIILFLAAFTQSCNYHYYQGTKLEEEGRFEEANIEYHRAYTQSPDDDDFREAYRRTSVKTAEDLMERYQLYLKKKNFHLAFHRLEQARTLRPDNPEINLEMKKWHRVLIAGRIDFKFRTLRNQVPLSDQMILQVRLNTFNPNRQLEAAIDNQTYVFSVEDVLYDPPQNILMFYTINSIGVNLVNRSRFLGKSKVGGAVGKLKNSMSSSRYQKFVDFRTPVLVKIQGHLNTGNSELLPVDQHYPIDLLKQANDSQFKYPAREIRYSLKLSENTIQVESTSGYIGFLPQMLYMNRQNRRIFLDFGHLELYQAKVGGLWSFRRIVSKDRTYLSDLRKNLLLNPYFYYRDGSFIFRKPSDY